MNKKFLKYSLSVIIIMGISLFISINKIHKNSSANEYAKNTEKTKASVASKDSNLESSLMTLEGTYFTPCLNKDGNKILYSSGDDIYEIDLIKNNVKQLTNLGNCYNPVYYEKDNNIIAFARNDGIYLINITENSIKKIISSKEPNISFAKPNFMPNGDLIYFKTKLISKEDERGFIEENPSINMISKDGKNDMKITEGYNPVLFKDGKTLVYEMGENLYLMNLQTKDKKLIDSGKYASFSNDGKYISYTKYEKETVPYANIKEKKNLFVDKEYSNVFIVETNNTKNKFKLTKEEFENKDKEIEEWAKQTNNLKTEQHFLIVSKIAYFDTLWSKDNKSLYISIYNSSKGYFELIKVQVPDLLAR
ncbi:hypothetical protein SAMN05428976_101162 [Clostridium sp. USBA 49]|uniref:TolB family protein n=1 Tax=Clostridium sp. USBA 49 TaxID=1881060 RepID=UPI00099AC320|nr:hypothetical protein [Clostridium sp. USBA 49]SKA73146.1 hypothetical protein SAMN05428976_101162 [Clostridium sp. USBA 49]